MDSTQISTSNSESTEGNFEYHSQLGREYQNTERVCQSVSFKISQYGGHQHRIDFDVLVTECQAIKEAMIFLSEPLDETYYDLIADDMFSERLPFELKRETYECRGDCLEDCRYIDSLTLIDGHLKIISS
uniref:Uncharacterized protein n=1 Tax=Pithovirus LCPAC202 TaxID=2506592 RepID=A0A481Z8C2_9VIRU|nr:MAG: uncharacterized protein LCPAC202_03230 [Pithovirus LCPAC202]